VLEKLLIHSAKRLKGGILVTVCVAAICDNSTVVGAADRMITAGDVEFEPPQTKIEAMTTSIAVMIAGDTGLQVEILYELRAQIKAHVVATPTQWLKVKDAANWYYEHFKNARNVRAERALLIPLGLDRNSFISRQQQMDSVLVNKLAGELVNFQPSEIEAIFAGVDDDGAHIYVVDNKGVSVRDAVGFAAIGAGYWHSNSAMMFAEHVKRKPMPDTLFLTYAAKRRAEVAPGVGAGTDMFMIGPPLGSYFAIGDHVLEELKGIYERTRQRAAISQETARTEVNKYVEELGKQSKATSGEQATQQPALPETGTDTKSSGEEAEKAGTTEQEN